MLGNRGVRRVLAGVLIAGAVALAIALIRRRRIDETRQNGWQVQERPPRTERPSPVRQTQESWPPEPILGRPTEADLARYAAQPPVRVPRLPDLPLPRLPEDRSARRKVLRWAAVVAAVCLLFGAAQMLEATVFGKQEEPQPGPREMVVWYCRPGADCVEP